MKLNLLDYMEVKSDSGSCPNWVFIDLVHECTNDENGIDWCETLLQFVKDLDDYIYGKKNKKQFYVSIKKDEYLIDDTEVLEDATLVFVIDGYEEDDDLNPFYDNWVKYELIKGDD